VIGAIAFFLMGGTKIFTGGFNLLTNPKQMAMLAIGIVLLVVIIMAVIKLRAKKEEFYYEYDY